MGQNFFGEHTYYNPIGPVFALALFNQYQT